MNSWNIFLKRLLYKTKWKRTGFFIGFDTIFILISLYLAFWLRFEGKIPSEYFPGFFYYAALALFIKILSLALFKVYNFSWGLFGLREAVQLMFAFVTSFVVFGGTAIIIRNNPPFSGFPRGVLLVDFVLTVTLLGGLRISKRFFKEIVLHRNQNNGNEKRVLIIGAGEAGVQVCKEMLHNPRSIYQPVAFIDDDVSKRGLRIQGVPVIGNRYEIQRALNETKAEEILLAIPSAPSKEMRSIVKTIRESGSKVPLKILPTLLDLVGSQAWLSQIEEVKVEDLLGREQVEIDYELIAEFLRGKRILVTGAGGSIGSEVVKQCLRFNPDLVLALDIDETELFNLETSLGAGNSYFLKIVADIRDEERLKSIFERYNPEIIIHGAAYKHVPVIEEFPEEAVKTNIFGTKILGQLSIGYKVRKFINISTDKAINPSSIMGASKRAAEEMLRLMNNKGVTKFISVRFGNVLGSRGSVIPVFKEQIRRGGPVTVTHPDMKRYFMTTLEAVLLILEAGAIGQGGETFVLDMGEPVKIDDLAREMIRLSGKEPDVDISIIYTGIRPGEKLFEELIGVEEGSEPTSYQKIVKAKSSKYRDESSLLKYINNLVEVSQNSGSREEIISLLKKIVPTYKPTA